jgi:indolepyruvate ferredoxin oxidoreductase
VIARRDKRTGHLRKQSFGPWMMQGFRLLSRLRRLRGTWLDPFGRTAERRMERALIGEYEQTLELLLGGLTPQNHALAVEIAAIPEAMRGFGHIKKRNVEAARTKRGELLARYGAAAAPQRAAA